MTAEDHGIVARLEAALNAHQDGLPIETVDKHLLRDALAEIRRLEQERDVKLRIWPDSGSPESDFELGRQLREQSIAVHTALSRAGVDATNDERPLTLAERIAFSLARADALQRELRDPLLALVDNRSKIAALVQVAQHGTLEGKCSCAEYEEPDRPCVYCRVLDRVKGYLETCAAELEQEIRRG